MVSVGLGPMVTPAFYFLACEIHSVKVFDRFGDLVSERLVEFRVRVVKSFELYLKTL